MKQPARLITPRGKTIELPADVYRQIQDLLAERKQKRSSARMSETIRQTFGKYKSGRSLTAALARDRAAEARQEKVRLGRRHG